MTLPVQIDTLENAAISAKDVPASPVRAMLRRSRRNVSVMVGVSIILIAIFLAMFAPLLAPHDPYAQNLANRLVPPVWSEGGGWDHILGTDNLGRDYLSRLIYGSRISLAIGFSVALISGVIGTSLGLIGGYFGGRIDFLLTFILTTRLSLPVVLVALAVVATAGGSLPIVVGILSLLLWDHFAIVARSTTMQTRETEYIKSARAIGSSHFRIMFREILPNISPALIVVATLEVTHAILLEAALSFLGMGVQPPLPSWGLMISEAKSVFLFHPWVVIFPGVAISLLVLAVNLLGDGLRDVMTPERHTQ